MTTFLSWPWWRVVCQNLPSLSVSNCLLLLAVGLIAWLIHKRRERARQWRKYGIPIAPLGLQMLFNFKECFKTMIREHGPSVGFIARNRMTLLTVDPDLIQKVMVNDFSNFTNRNELFVTSTGVTDGAFFAKDQEWKHKRQILARNFSTSKLKALFRITGQKAQRLSDVVTSYARGKGLVPIKRLAVQYTGEIIAHSGFGCHFDCLGNAQLDEFSHHCENLFRHWSKWERVLISLVFTQRWLQVLLIKILKLSYFDVVNTTTYSYFTNLIYDVVDRRVKDMSQGRTTPADFLQTLINASELVQRDSPLDEGRQKPLTPEEVVIEMILIIFAGFHTTSLTLHFALYFLAVDQGVQERVFQEIQHNVKGDDSTPITYEELSRLRYTQQVIDETLRLCPPIIFLDRKARHQQTYGNMTIPVDTNVTVPLYLLHREPGIYPDPDTFDPNRFSEQQRSSRPSYAYIPFGGGPRQCQGVRLAYVEIKMALVHVLRKVRVFVSDRTWPRKGGSLKLNDWGISHPEEPITLEVELREGNEDAR